MLVLFWLLSGGKFAAGDVKLWLALLWSLPLSIADIGSALMFVVLVGTAGLQIVLREWRRDPHGQDQAASPAAWRTVVFMALLICLNTVPKLYV